MALDPSIPLGIKSPRIELDDPLDRAGKSFALQNLMRQGELQQRALTDDEAVRAAYQQAGGDSARLRALLQGGGQFKALEALDTRELARRKAEADIRKDTAAAGKSEHDVHIDRLQRGAALFEFAKDQDSYDQVVRFGIMSGVFDPKVIESFPRQFTPQAVEQLRAAGLTRAQQLQDQRAREQQAETVRGHTLTAATTRRGQDLTDARAREAAERGRWVNDLERGIQINMDTGESRPIVQGAAQPSPGPPPMPLATPTAPVVASRPALTLTQPAPAAPRPIAPRTTEAQRKELMSIDQQAKTIEGALRAVAETPSAFSLERGAATMIGPMAESIRGRLDSPKERTTRSYVYNVVSKVINERAGAAQSVQELARLRSFLPAEADNAQQVKDKLEGFQTYLKDLRSGVGAGGVGVPAAPATSAAAATGWKVEELK